MQSQLLFLIVRNIMNDTGSFSRHKHPSVPYFKNARWSDHSFSLKKILQTNEQIYWLNKPDGKNKYHGVIKEQGKTLQNIFLHFLKRVNQICKNLSNKLSSCQQQQFRFRSILLFTKSLRATSFSTKVLFRKSRAHRTILGHMAQLLTCETRTQWSLPRIAALKMIRTNVKRHRHLAHRRNNWWGLHIHRSHGSHNRPTSILSKNRRSHIETLLPPYTLPDHPVSKLFAFLGEETLTAKVVFQHLHGIIMVIDLVIHTGDHIVDRIGSIQPQVFNFLLHIIHQS